MDWSLASLVTLVAAGAAGFVDAIVGGGGLVLVPALFAIYPTAAPATLFGTNKSASVFGTAAAALQFAGKVQLRWIALLPGVAAAGVGSFCGEKSYGFSHWYSINTISSRFIARKLQVYVAKIEGGVKRLAHAL